MKVKRYEGASEAVLMPIILEEMGPGATIISVKEKPPTGFFAFLKKPKIVITAAYDDDEDVLNILKNPDSAPGIDESIIKEVKPLAKSLTKPVPNNLLESNIETETESIEASMNLLLQEARKAANQIEIDETSKRSKLHIETEQKNQSVPSTASSKNSLYAHMMVQLFYDTMISQDVLPEVASHILKDLEDLDGSQQIDVKILIKSVYGFIVDILKDPVLINTTKNNKDVIFFMGPTGVGKTTTIAKLSSVLTLRHGLKIGLITADTYRIAAVEQLKTYADILGIDIRVVYSADEMQENLEDLKSHCDVVLIDSAGRSHKNKEGIEELKDLLQKIPEAKRYLVLSVTTRYEDLYKIVNVYKNLTDFNLIFTKLDESESMGSLMNICCLSGKKAAYVTFGQNVPDDFEAVKPDKVAKALLGLNNEENSA